MKESTKNGRGRVALFGNLRVLSIAAVLVAMSIVCGKYLAIRGGEILRFSFENLPILLAGIWFGPLVGAVTAVVADLLGCVLVGYAVNPVVTVGAALIGATSGLCYRYGSGLPQGARLLLAVGSAHLFGSVVIKTLGLAAFYDMPVLVLMLWRLLNYAIVGGVEYLLIYALLKNRGIQSLMHRK